MELICRRLSRGASVYTLEDEGGAPVGTIDFLHPHHGAIEVGTDRFRPEREARGRWRLLGEGGASIATAERLNLQPLRLQLSLEDATWLLEPESGRRHNILVDGQQRGQIDKRIRLFSSHLRVSASAALPLPATAFALWLIGTQWVGIAGVAGAAAAER